MQSQQLKIKHKTLAAEAKFIRKEMNKVKHAARSIEQNSRYYYSEISEEELERREEDARNFRKNYLDMQKHNSQVVSVESRCTHLARGFLNGTEYQVIENKTRPFKNIRWDIVERMVQKYGDSDNRHLMQSFSEWKSEASA